MKMLSQPVAFWNIPLAATLTLPMPVLNPAVNSQVTVGIDGGPDLIYSFAPSDPGGDVYMGPASGNPHVDAGTLASFIEGQTTATTSVSGNNLTVTSVTTGSSSQIILSGFLNGTANGRS